MLTLYTTPVIYLYMERFVRLARRAQGATRATKPSPARLLMRRRRGARTTLIRRTVRRPAKPFSGIRVEQG